MYTEKQLEEIYDYVSLICWSRLKKLPANIEYDDLYQIGVLAALQQESKFDIEKGTLKTYLHTRIHGSITDYLRQIDITSRRNRDKLKAAYKKQEQHAQKYNEEICINNVADMTNLIHVLSQPLSLDGTDTKDLTFEYMIEGVSIDPAVLYINKYKINKILYELSKLPVRECNILVMHFQGVKNYVIGYMYNVTESRISQIISEHIKKLRKVI